jgi:hypothetical protein
MKKIYITEKQLNEIIGVDLSYLNRSEGNRPVTIGDEEIFTTDNVDVDTEDPTTDKIAKSKYPRSYYGAKKRNITLNCSMDKKKINESNQDLVDKYYNIPNKLYKLLKNNLSQYSGDISGIKRLKNLIDMKSLSTNEMYRIKNKLSSLEKDSDEYNLIGGDEMLRWVDKELKHAKNVSYNRKKINKDLGRENSFISSHNKNSNNGKGHTKNGGVTFKYEN